MNGSVNKMGNFKNIFSLTFSLIFFYCLKESIYVGCEKKDLYALLIGKLKNPCWVKSRKHIPFSFEKNQEFDTIIGKPFNLKLSDDRCNRKIEIDFFGEASEKLKIKYMNLFYRDKITQENSTFFGSIDIEHDFDLSTECFLRKLINITFNMGNGLKCLSNIEFTTIKTILSNKEHSNQLISCPGDSFIMSLNEINAESSKMNSRSRNIRSQSSDSSTDDDQNTIYLFPILKLILAIILFIIFLVKRKKLIEFCR